MSIKTRLAIASFLQFLVWGSWLTTLGVYMFNTLNFSGGDIAKVYSTMGIAAIIMPALVGMICDRWINSERLLSFSIIAGAVILFIMSSVSSYNNFFLLMLLYTMLYMPTLGLINTISYNALKLENLDVVTAFPPIRVWGTIGFICGMWLVDLLKWTDSSNQLLLAAGISIIYGVYVLSLPKCPPLKKAEKTSFSSIFGLDAFALFKEKRIAVFLIFSMLIGAALQITNTFGQPFLRDFEAIDVFKDSFTVQHPGILTSISQISESLFILAIPFFLKRYGIKTVMLMSIGAWVLRFFFFGIGDPGSGFIFLLLSMIVYGMAFDFFNISGSLFMEENTDASIRASAQGLFVLMTNGIGTIIGTLGSGYVVDHFTAADGTKDWPSIWFVFAGYALVLGIAFVLLFKNSKKGTQTI